MQLISREQAKQSGLLRYFTGAPCKRGHVSERLVSNFTCFECKRIADRKQYEKDPNKFVLKASKWSAANRDKTRQYAATHNARHRDSRLAYNKKNAQARCAYSRDWYAKNTKRALEACSAWYAANKDKVRVYGRNRRARVRNAEGSHTIADIRRLLGLQKEKCAACKRSIKSGYHVDHVMPLISGGSNGAHNLQLLCPRCNLQKNRKDPIQWQQERGYLL